MEKRQQSLEFEITSIVEKFLKAIEEKEIQVISHFDTDGITSATIMIQTLQELDKKFSVKIVKSLDKELIENLSKDKITIFLDLASNSLNHIKDAQLSNTFIIDHHEISQEIPENINIINPELNGNQKLSGSCLTYLFCKKINSKNKKFAKLAILGMIGDMLEKEIDTLNNGILDDGEIQRKRGILIYPSTRPLNRTLEFCSNPYIPEVTGNIKGVLELLRETGLGPVNKKYKSLLELNEEEMEKLVTAIMLRNPKSKSREIIGDIFLIKMFNKLEDARELSAMINACSRLGRSDIAIQFCMEIPQIKKKAESIHAKYKQLILSGLKFISETEKIQEPGFVIINAQDNIKDTMIGTMASILSRSSLYEEGTVVVAMSYYENNIKVSARRVGKNGRNVREILSRVMCGIQGEVGGHACAAGCVLKKEQEQEFINTLRKHLEIEVIKV
ncbi:MAG: DHH family phosphoesterase [Nanoarchaeota archaeon]|nr:DHH family phosphoesterase [Nanoarchaeota archaeon]MBU4116521.1 DHH family phosphoesterase [Nanoarchaeota archaeon]